MITVSRILRLINDAVMNQCRETVAQRASVVPHLADMSSAIPAHLQQQQQQHWVFGNNSGSDAVTHWSQLIDSGTCTDWLRYVYGASNLHQRLLQLRLLQLAHQFNCI